LRAVREAADQLAIRRAMARADGNVSGAARLLGVSRPTLYDLMKSYNLG
jgi:two-component system NtrC family response regulator